MNMKNQRGFAPVLLLVLLVIVAGAAYYLGTKNTKRDTQTTEVLTSSPVVTAEVHPTIAPTSSEKMPTKTTTMPTANGAPLENIKYTLPSTWTSKLENGGLTLSANGGGYFHIRTYTYPGTMGRREFYCSLSSVCIEGTSYFNPMMIGNIDGYSANALDNSGSGIEYFGAKGNVFYVISSYGPPSPSEFENTYRDVMNSLVF